MGYNLILEKEVATHSSALAWKIPWTEEPGRLQSMGSQRVRHDWATSLSLFTFMHWRRKWQPTPVFLPGESQGQRSLVGCRLWGRTESDTTEATLQQQQHNLILYHLFSLSSKLSLIWPVGVPISSDLPAPPPPNHSSSASILSDPRRYPRLSSCSFSALAPESAFFPSKISWIHPFSDRRYLETQIWVFPIIIVDGYLLFLSLLRGQS